jgi:hypothetical protein
VVVLVFESPLTTRASNRLFRWMRLRHSLRSRLLNDSMSPLSHPAWAAIKGGQGQVASISKGTGVPTLLPLLVIGAMVPLTL